jgi:hypothetical protein
LAFGYGMTPTAARKLASGKKIRKEKQGRKKKERGGKEKPRPKARHGGKEKPRPKARHGGKEKPRPKARQDHILAGSDSGTRTASTAPADSRTARYRSIHRCASLSDANGPIHLCGILTPVLSRSVNGLAKFIK